MRKVALWLVILLATLVGVSLPGQVTQASVSAAETLGCNGEPVQEEPYIAPPFRYGRSIHFGYAEWHFPPSCDDEMRRNYVKVYKVRAGPDPKVYSTTGDRGSKRFAKGKYRVKVSYGYRYYDEDTGEYSEWYILKTSKVVRIR